MEKDNCITGQKFQAKIYPSKEKHIERQNNCQKNGKQMNKKYCNNFLTKCKTSVKILNRPGVAGAVLSIPLSLIQ